MKKVTLSLVAAGLAVSSLGAHAALPTTAAPFQVVVPNLASGLELTVEGLYVQPTNSDLGFADTYSSSSSSNTTSHTLHYLDPDYDFGFRVGLGYVFPNSGNDVQLSWTHLDQSDDASATRASRWRSSTYTYKTDVDFKYDAVDLDVGQFVSIGTRLQNRLFIGLRGAELKMDRTDTTARTNDSRGRRSTTQTYDSKFVGIGPRIGIDTSYHIGNCFGLVGHFATALLVGNVDADASNAYARGYRNIRHYVDTYTADTQTRIVPAFDAKLGLNYTVLFKNANASSLSIEAGYQVTEYLDAIDRIAISSSSRSSSNTANVTTSSFGFHGPYLSLNFKI